MREDAHVNEEKPVFKCILVPTDGSPLAIKAIEPAVQLAKEQNAKIVGFYVAPAYRGNVFEESTTLAYVSPQEYEAQVKGHAEKVLDAVKSAASAAGVPCTCAHATSDFPYEEILKAAKRYDCDLIYMSSHGRRGISQLLLGSETSKVLAHTTIPVLVHR
jgi:nucleotide-binding universal stress UspA family protein